MIGSRKNCIRPRHTGGHGLRAMHPVNPAQVPLGALDRVAKRVLWGRCGRPRVDQILSVNQRHLPQCFHLRPPRGLHPRHLLPSNKPAINSRRQDTVVVHKQQSRDIRLALMVSLKPPPLPLSQTGGMMHMR